MRLLPYGDRAILVELGDRAERRRLDRRLRRGLPDGAVEHVAGDRTVLVRAAATAALPSLAAALRGLALDAEPDEPGQGDDVEIEVTYDGPDLGAVADHLGIAREEVVRRHTGQAWSVEFAGFAPGFGYLLGARGGLEVPRLSSPRTRIPAGSVGLAGAYSGIYPRASSGGWRLIGRTRAVLWDPDRSPPALLYPGRSVRFRSADGRPG